MIRIVTVLLSTLLWVGMTQAEVYTWKDASGKIVYSDQPPTGGAQTLNLNGRLAPEHASKPAAASAVKPTDPAAENAKIAEQNAKVAAENAKIRAQNCKNAQNNLNGLQQNGRIKMPGGTGLATDAQRAELINQAKKDVDIWCSK